MSPEIAPEIQFRVCAYSDQQCSQFFYLTSLGFSKIRPNLKVHSLNYRSDETVVGQVVMDRMGVLLARLLLLGFVL